MAVPNEHTFPHLATLGDCSIKTALRWLKTKHWIGKYIGMHPGMSLALATFTNHSPKLPYLSNCITWVKIFFWKHRVNFVHYVLLPTEQAETYLKIYYLTHILRRVVKKNNGYFTVRLTVIGGGVVIWQKWKILNWPVPTSGVIFQPIWGRKL